jgi:hypothetical protein
MSGDLNAFTITHTVINEPGVTNGVPAHLVSDTGGQFVEARIRKGTFWSKPRTIDRTHLVPVDATHLVANASGARTLSAQIVVDTPISVLIHDDEKGNEAVAGSAVHTSLAKTHRVVSGRHQDAAAAIVVNDPSSKWVTVSLCRSDEVWSVAVRIKKKKLDPRPPRIKVSKNLPT